MDERRDRDLGERLSALPVPEHAVRFWSQVESSLEDEAALRAPRLPSLGATLAGLETPDHRPGYWKDLEEVLRDEASSLPRTRRRRWPEIVAAAAAAAAATFIVAAWFGLPWSQGGLGRAVARVFQPPLERSATPARLDGDIVVWSSRLGTHHATGQPRVGIYTLDVTGMPTDRVVAIDPYPSWKQQATSDAGLVVWVDGRNDRFAVYGCDIGDPHSYRIAELDAPRPSSFDLETSSVDLQNIGDPAIDKGIVVWTDPGRHQGDIFAYDVRDGRTFPVCNDRWAQREPAISGRYVVWADGRNDAWGMGGSEFYRNGWDIYMSDLVTGNMFALCREADDQIHPEISGSVVVWQDGRNRTVHDPDNWDIYGYDLRSRREIKICVAPGPQTDPAIDGDLVVWTDGASAPAATSRTAATAVRGYSLRSERRFTVTDEPGIVGFASISGTKVIWVGAGTGPSQLAVYGATIVGHGGRLQAEPLVP
jgi:beta propeller repeat protein